MLRPIGVVSMLTGCVLACCAAAPSVLSSLSTVELLGIATLVFGPALTLCAMRLDRRWGVADPRANGAGVSVARTTTHEAHDRSARTHPRPLEAHEDTRVHEHAA